jgi:hypothetical protein
MFSLYNYMQTLNSDIEAVLEQTVQLDHEVTVHTCEQDEQDSIRHRILDELQTRMQATSEATQQAEEENKMLQEFVLQIGKKVNTLFFKIQCDQMDSKGKEGADGKGGAGGAGAGGQASSTRKGATMSRPEGKVALLQQQGVTDSNVLEFLGCIEQRSVDVISEYLRRQASGKPNFPLSPTPGPASPMHMAAEQPHVDIDQLADEDLAVDGEDDGRIVDLSSFKTKLKRRLVSTLCGGVGCGLERGLQLLLCCSWPFFSAVAAAVACSGPFSRLSALPCALPCLALCPALSAARRAGCGLSLGQHENCRLFESCSARCCAAPTKSLGAARWTARAHKA